VQPRRSEAHSYPVACRCRDVFFSCCCIQFRFLKNQKKVCVYCAPRSFVQAGLRAAGLQLVVVRSGSLPMEMAMERQERVTKPAAQKSGLKVSRSTRDISSRWRAHVRTWSFSTGPSQHEWPIETYLRDQCTTTTHMTYVTLLSALIGSTQYAYVLRRSIGTRT
jgi:hypothetical protein